MRDSPRICRAKMRKSLRNNAITLRGLCLMSDFVEDPTTSADAATVG